MVKWASFELDIIVRWLTLFDYKILNYLPVLITYFIAEHLWIVFNINLTWIHGFLILELSNRFSVGGKVVGRSHHIHCCIDFIVHNNCFLHICSNAISIISYFRNLLRINFLYYCLKLIALYLLFRTNILMVFFNLTIQAAILEISLIIQIIADLILVTIALITSANSPSAITVTIPTTALLNPTIQTL